eukprot:403364417
MAAQKAQEEKENAIKKLEKLKEMKTFLDDFHQGEDYFKDVVPQRENEESKFRVISDNSWYIEGDIIFNIELKDQEKENCFDKDKVKESLEIFLSSDGKDGYGKVSENNLIKTRRIDEKMNSRLPFESNFCLRIYTFTEIIMTELKILLSYDLSISHLNEDFSIQVYDREDFEIICDGFFYYIEYKNLLKFYFDSEKDDTVMYRLMRLKDETIKEHDKIYNMVHNNNYKIFFRKGYISEANTDKYIEVQQYSKEKDKLAINSFLEFVNDLPLVQIEYNLINIPATLTSKNVAESYESKAQLIEERESLFSNEEFKNEKYFPSYIIFKRPVRDQTEENQEWQGFVKEIKMTIQKTQAKNILAEKGILHHVKSVETMVKGVESTVRDLQTIIKNQDQIIKSHESQNKVLQTTVNQMNNDIKNLIQSLLKNSEYKQIKESINEEVKEVEKQLIVQIE